MLTIVLECNILVMCLTSRSPYHLIYRALIEGKFNLALSTEIIILVLDKQSDKKRAILARICALPFFGDTKMTHKVFK